MNKNIVVSNSKGGAGKSTVSEYLALISSRAGKKTLLIDAGYQRHSSNAFLSDEQIKHNLLDGLRNKRLMPKCVYNISENLDLIPATINLNNFSDEFGNIQEYQKELIFKTVLSPTLAHYSNCIFDTESSLGVLTRNALIMANVLIIPIVDKYSVDEALKLLETLETLKESYGDFMNLEKIYVLPVMKRFLSMDYIKILNIARREIREAFLLPVKYHSQIFLGDNKTLFDIRGGVYKDYKKSLEDVI